MQTQSDVDQIIGAAPKVKTMAVVAQPQFQIQVGAARV